MRRTLIASADVFHKGEIMRVRDGRGRVVETWKVRWTDTYHREPTPKDEVCFDIKGYKATEHL